MWTQFSPRVRDTEGRSQAAPRQASLHGHRPRPVVYLCGPFSPHFIFKADFSSGKTRSSQLTC